MLPARLTIIVVGVCYITRRFFYLTEFFGLFVNYIRQLVLVLFICIFFVSFNRICFQFRFIICHFNFIYLLVKQSLFHFNLLSIISFLFHFISFILINLCYNFGFTCVILLQFQVLVRSKTFILQLYMKYNQFNKENECT